MSKIAIKRKPNAPHRSPAVEEAARELARHPITEACVSGSCDICLSQADSCDIAGQRAEDAHSPGRSAEKKNK